MISIIYDIASLTVRRVVSGDPHGVVAGRGERFLTTFIPYGMTMAALCASFGLKHP
jgi:hypothetical protein